ncbi:MAG: calcium-binding protein [Phenylobacterium sp.]|nr:calcium-binding protein [Phenylobacterium sp.]
MATYVFGTIGAAQALAFNSSDTLNVEAGTATQTTVIFNPDGTYGVTIGSTTNTFGAGFSQGAGPTRANFPDGTKLWVGSSGSDNIRLTVTATTGAGAGYGGAGNDSIQSVGGGYWLVQGNQGDDRIVLDGGSQTVYGGQDNDYIFVGGVTTIGSRNFMQGNRGEDTLIGSGNPDTILGGQGNDQLTGSGGLDTLNGNLGDDVITGAGLIAGEGGNDVITVDSGIVNALVNTPITSTVLGGDGDDRITITPNEGPQTSPGANVNGGEGNDYLLGGNGSDTLMGGGGADTIVSAGANVGNDVLDGGAGADVISARIGSNILQGGADNDRITGGNGADTIDGGTGLDTMTGDAGPGFGVDVFVLDDPYFALEAGGFDRITDWSVADRFRLSFVVGPSYAETTAGDFTAAVLAAQNTFAAGATEVLAVQVGGDVVLFVDGGARNTIETGVILVGRSLADISETNFI